MVGRLAVVVGGLMLAGCEVWDQIPPFTQDDPDSAVDAWSSDRDAYVPVEGGLDAPVVDSRAPGDGSSNDGAPEDVIETDAEGSSITNPCPKPGAPCCGYDPDSGTNGLLYLAGSGRQKPGICDECLALECDASTQFCCAAAGDAPPQCFLFSRGTACVGSN